LANYNLGNLNAGVQQNAAQNAVVGAANEQMNALNQAGSAYNQIQQNQQFNAQQIQTNAYNQAQLQGTQLGLQGQELQNYINNNAQQIANSMQGAQAGQTLQSNQNTSLNQIGATATNNAASHSIGGDIMNLEGSVASSAGSLAKFSDRKLKTKIKPAKKDLEKFIATMRGVKWVL
jgi:2-methylaconitate cis-trans-isomerase PrpF